jgi:hypothetical protein
VTRKNCLISQQHWNLIVSCHNGTLLGSCLDPIVNAMSNCQPPMSNALLGLPRAPKAFQLQHTMIGKINMVANRRLSPTSDFAPMTSSVVSRTSNVLGKSIGLRYLYLAHSEWHSSDMLGDTSIVRCRLQVPRTSINVP